MRRYLFSISSSGGLGSSNLQEKVDSVLVVSSTNQTQSQSSPVMLPIVISGPPDFNTTTSPIEKEFSDMSNQVKEERVCLVKWKPTELNQYLAQGWNLQQIVPRSEGFYAVVERAIEAAKK